MPDRQINYVERQQGDGLQDHYSDAGGLDCSNLPDRTRQEFKADTDINTILGRFDIDTLKKPLVFGEFDYDIDLQRGLLAIEAAKTAFANLDPRLKQKYSTWMDLLEAIETGTFTTQNQPEKTPTPTVPAAPPA